jgi:methionyl-tRNA formyltransferase
MKIVFFGTPDYVLPILVSIHKKFVTGPGKSPIVAVVTQSPKPTGRKKVLAYSPIDKWAHDRKIPVYYSPNDLLDNPPNADLGILASYGEIIKKDVINLFPHGILVVHPSLLPKYRGASPIPAAIKNGETVTGVSIIKMDEKMDHGPIVSQFKEDILPSDTTGVLRSRLFERSAQVLTDLIPSYIEGKIKLKIQDDSQATFTKLMKKDDGFIDLTKTDPVTAERFVRAMDPWPIAWTYVTLRNEGEKRKVRLKIIKAHLEDGKFVPDIVQLEGKNPVQWKQFAQAYKDSLLLPRGKLFQLQV